MKHLVCALMMVATTALELEYLASNCPDPKMEIRGSRYYNGKTNAKHDPLVGNDFTIFFTLGSIDS